jgi:hypothetical protein
MKASLVISLVTSMILLGSPAHAGDRAACLDAASQGQTLRDAHRLVEARDTFRVCARQGCPLVLQRDCTMYFEQVQTSLPTVVPFATDASGNGVGGVKVSVDGKLLADKIDGRSVEIDPGTHTFLFEAPDGTKTERTVLVAEGQKEIRIAAVVAKPVEKPAPVPAQEPPLPVEIPAPATSTPASDSVSPPAERASAFPWKAVGLAAGGVGIVTLGFGTTFGLMAISSKNGANCAPSGLCQNENAVNKQDDSLHAGNLSTALFIAGGVLAAAGVTMFALAPSVPVQAGPSVGSREAGFVLTGAW